MARFAGFPHARLTPLAPLLLLLPLLMGAACARGGGGGGGGGVAPCLPDRLALFRLRLDTHWTRELFPKQYPEFRPPAQWSRLVGRSHDARFKLFRVGVEAGDALATFAESGRGDALEAQDAQGAAGAVLDAFGTAALATGAGRVEASFFADGNHTKVSTVVHLIPSPDWFVGMDSVDLCERGHWIESLTIQAWPLDAGSDSGFTFTAPNWPSEPRQPVTRISAHAPSHPASSFYYPELRRLPPIATFRIKLEKTFRATGETGSGAGSQGSAGVLSNDVVPEAADAPHAPRSPYAGAAPLDRHGPRRRPNKQRRKKTHRAGATAAAACVAGPWGAWSACSAACGVGQSWRERRVLREARGGGEPCPPLREARSCAGDSDCPQRFFAW